MGWGKLVRVGIIGCCLLSSLTACGPHDANAQVGVTVDEAGNPVLVLQDCDGKIDKLEVDVPVVPGQIRPDGIRTITLTAKKARKGVTHVPVLAGGNGWASDSTAPSFAAVGDYSASASGEGGNYQGGGVIFSLADLKALKPGQIRHHIPPPAGVTYPTARFVSSDFYWVTPVEDFAPERCPKKK